MTPESPPGLLLVFTIDTEGSIVRQRHPDPERVVDELILGDYGTGERGGIRLHMDLLERFGLRGCFFVDVLMEYQFGREALERTIDAIATRGHEIQLHVHDHHLAWSSDPALQSLSRGLLRKDADDFRRLMEVSADLFERRTGDRPLAYRAGGYRIRDAHFGVLEEFGISIDSSVLAFSNSEVADWMRTRTQPFWVGGVLELPVGWILVRDSRSSPQALRLAPTDSVAEPVSPMPAPRSGPPWVATYVSHSFQLMREDRDASPQAVATLEGSVREKVAPDVADRLLRPARRNMRIFDGTLDRARIASVEELLGRIADRPDAACVTYGELSAVAKQFWSDRRLEPVDPVPALDRPRRLATVSGSRIYSAGLLRHLAATQPAEPSVGDRGDQAIAFLEDAGVSWEGREVALIETDGSGSAEWLRRRGARVSALGEPDDTMRDRFDLVAWPAGFERCRPERLRKRLESAAAMLRADGLLLLRVWTLGVCSAAQPGWPPLAELLFSPRELRAAGGGDVEPADVVAWDATTFAGWFSERGFESVRERRAPRSPAELEAIDRFQDKLRELDPEELQIGSLDLTLRRSPRVRALAEEGDRSRADPATAPRFGAKAMRELADRFGPITPEDSVLAIHRGAGSRVSVPRSRTRLTWRDLLRRVRGRDWRAPLIGRELESLLRSPAEPEAYEFILWAGIESVDPEALEAAAEAIQRSLRPGGKLLIRMKPGEGPASATTVLVSLLRAGLEVTGAVAEPPLLDCRLIRPLDHTEIARFAGVG